MWQIWDLAPAVQVAAPQFCPQYHPVESQRSAKGCFASGPAEIWHLAFVMWPPWTSFAALLEATANEVCFRFPFSAGPAKREI